MSVEVWYNRAEVKKKYPICTADKCIDTSCMLQWISFFNRTKPVKIQPDKSLAIQIKETVFNGNNKQVILLDQNSPLYNHN